MGFLDALNNMLSDDKEFIPKLRVRNRTGYDIHELYMSESTSDDWEEDILGDDILEDGDMTNINFESVSSQRYWDIKTVDEDDDEAVFEDIDLSKTTRVTLYYDDDGNACVDCD